MKLIKYIKNYFNLKKNILIKNFNLSSEESFYLKICKNLK